MTTGSLRLPRAAAPRLAPARSLAGPARVAWLVRRRWRRSLQLRVVVTTLAISAVVVGLLASLLLDQVGRGLVDTKTRTSLSEAQSGEAQAQSRLNNLGVEGAPAVVNELTNLTQELSDRGAADHLYSVVVLSPTPGTSTFVSAGVDAGDIPADLLRRLDERAGPLYTYAQVPDGRGGRAEGLVVGAVLHTPIHVDYRLFHLFPLTSEQQSLGLVQRTVAGAGLVLVGLLALIAGLVTRQVVAPVRLAAQTAEKLAAGRLEERLQVRGEDEVARLGATFNSMADALQRQIRQLEDLSRLQRRFVSDVSHELRTPLTTVRMAADVLHESRGAFAPDARRSAELLQAELDRFEGMLGDLLEISRYDAGAASLEAEPTDLVAVAERVVLQTEGLAGHRGSPVTVSVAGGARPVVLEVDAVRLERVVRNLVVNAVEHGEGLPVQVEIAGDDVRVCLVVRDHGVGLRPGEAEMVFRRFWRGDPSRARATGGTGLGLAIALEDVRLHGGTLEAWGRPGGGAAFRLTLPRRAGEPVGDRELLPLAPVGSLR